MYLKLFGIRSLSDNFLYNPLSDKIDYPIIFKLILLRISKLMTDIRTTDFCDKYGYTQAQMTYAKNQGKLKSIKRGVIDEELSLQALKDVIPAKAKIQSDQEGIISKLQNEIQMLRAELQSSLELNLRYQTELKQQDQSESKPRFSGEQLQQNQEQLARHPFLSQQWLKDSFLPQQNSESSNKSHKVQIPAEYLRSGED